MEDAPIEPSSQQRAWQSLAAKVVKHVHARFDSVASHHSLADLMQYLEVCEQAYRLQMSADCYDRRLMEEDDDDED